MGNPGNGPRCLQHDTRVTAQGGLLRARVVEAARRARESNATQVIYVDDLLEQKSAMGCNQFCETLQDDQGRRCFGEIGGSRRTLTVVRDLGGGGMSDTFWVENLANPDDPTSPKIQSVLKIMDPKGAKQTELDRLLMRFSEEQRLLAELKADPDGADFVGIKETGYVEINEEKRPYILMEAVHGETLEDMIDNNTKQGNRLTMGGISSIFGKHCRAIGCSHSHGIINRDVKPGNLIVKWSGVGEEHTIKVLDLGIARQGRTGRRITLGDQDEGELIGTPWYMAPELISGQEATYKSDVFALGIVLYQMWVGKVPYESTDICNLMKEILRTRIMAPRDGDNPMPAALADIVDKACSDNPAERHEDANDLLAEWNERLPEILTQAREIELRMNQRTIERSAAPSAPPAQPATASLRPSASPSPQQTPMGMPREAAPRSPDESGRSSVPPAIKTNPTLPKWAYVAGIGAAVCTVVLGAVLTVAALKTNEPAQQPQTNVTALPVKMDPVPTTTPIQTPASSPAQAMPAPIKAAQSLTVLTEAPMGTPAAPEGTPAATPEPTHEDTSDSRHHGTKQGDAAVQVRDAGTAAEATPPPAAGAGSSDGEPAATPTPDPFQLFDRPQAATPQPATPPASPREAAPTTPPGSISDIWER